MKTVLAASILLASAFALPQPQAGSGGSNGSGDDNDEAVTCNPFYTDQNILDAIAGTWSLINTTSALNGVPQPDRAYGENPHGIITYSRSGWMSATITATEPELRPENLRFPFQPEDSDADWALVGKHGLFYAGPVTISRDITATPGHGQIFHGPLTVANVPDWVGALQRRNYTVYSTREGKLLNIGSDRGNGQTGNLWWRKVD